MSTSLINQHDQTMTRSETRQIVTPYAFEVAPELFGTPLASPVRRATALLIDLFLVALLTNVSSVFWAGLVAVMFFRAGNRVKKGGRFNWLRKILRLFAAILLFAFALAIIDDVMDKSSEIMSDNSAATNENVSGMQALEVVTLTAKYVSNTQTLSSQVQEGICSPAMTCWTSLAQEFVDDIANTQMSDEDATDLFALVSEQAKEQLTETDSQQLVSMMEARFREIRQSEPKSDNRENTSSQTPALIDLSDDEDTSRFGIVDWIIKFADDLGVGFGWAALYFTALTTWFQGRTVGKKIMGIKVIKLNNKRINLWESFERYGGYAAGLVTGLLGFLQIFWDPNRQAIQDKISETLVIDTRKPKVELDITDNGESLTSSS